MKSTTLLITAIIATLGIATYFVFATKSVRANDISSETTSTTTATSCNGSCGEGSSCGCSKGGSCGCAAAGKACGCGANGGSCGGAQ